MSFTGISAVLTYLALAGLLFKLGDRVAEHIERRTASKILEHLKDNQVKYIRQFGDTVYFKTEYSVWLNQFSRKTRTMFDAERSAQSGAF